METSKKPCQAVKAFLTTSFPGPFEVSNAYGGNADLFRNLTFTVHTMTSGDFL